MQFEEWWKAQSSIPVSVRNNSDVESCARRAWEASAEAHRPKGALIDLEKASAEALLAALMLKGGAEGACAEAALLFHKKGKDYNTDVERDEYFPLGLPSYAQMLFVKALRMISLAKVPRGTNFESARDTALDIISYGAFCADWLKRRGTEERRPRLEGIVTSHKNSEGV